MAIDKTSLKVMNRLFDKGYTTEKAVTAFNLEDVCVIECYAPVEIARIIALKEAVKANKVISFSERAAGENRTGVIIISKSGAKAGHYMLAAYMKRMYVRCIYRTQEEQ